MFALLTWLRSLCVSRIPRGVRRRRYPNRPMRTRSARLRLERLEDRTVPSTVTWVGGTSGDWDTPTNWSTGKLPGATDDVVINTANATVTHQYNNSETIHSLTTSSTDALSWSAGNLTISSASTLSGALNLSGGTWQGGGNVTLDGLLTWTGGTMKGSSSTTANAGIDFSGSGSEILDGRTLNNASGSTAVWSGTNNIGLYDGAVFDNEAGATFDINLGGRESITNSGILGTFKNQGTLDVASGVNTAYVQDHFLNAGAVNLASGQFVLLDGGSGGGSYTVASAATLQFSNGTFQLGSSSSVTGAGAVDFYSNGSGTTDVSGTYNVSGSTTVMSGTVTFTSTCTLTSLGSTVTLNGGGFTRIAKNVSIATLNLYDGTLTGPAAVTVTGTLNWNDNGTMSGTGSTTLASGATLNLGGDGTFQVLDTRTFNNAGTANWLANSGTLYMEDRAVFNNQSGAGFTIAGNSFIYPVGNTGAFNNAGTFTEAAGTDTTYIGVLFNNSGTVNITSGTLGLFGGGNDTKGAFNVPAAGALQFVGGNTHLASTIGVNSTTKKAVGPILFGGGNTVVLGAYYVSGATTINGGATVDFDNKTDSLSTLNLGNGTLTGSAAVTVTGALTWNDDGTMSGGGSTILASTGTMSLGGDSSYQTLDQRTFTASGKTNWLAGSGGYFNLIDGATFNNKGAFTINCDQSVQTGDRSGVFNNSGTFTKAAGSGTTGFDVAFNNSGTVNVNSGTLDLDGGNDTKGTFYVPATGTLEFGGGGTYVGSAIGSSTSKTAGTILFSGGTTTLVGAYNAGPTSITTINGGIADFDNKTDSIPTLNLYNGTLTGSATVTVAGTLDWNDYGTMSGTGTTTLTSTGTLNLGGDGSYQTLDTRTFNNAGTANWSADSSTFYLDNGAVFNNQAGAVFNAQSDQLVQSSGATGVFNNAGTFTKTSAVFGSSGTEFNGIPFNNSGTVNVNSGILNLAGGGTDSSAGKFFVPADGLLEFGGGNTVVNSSIGTASNAQAGTVDFSGGNTDINGSYNVSGYTIVPGGYVDFTGLGALTSLGNTVDIDNGGTADIAPNATIATFSLGEGTLTGPGAITVTGSLNWNGYGIMSGTGSTTLTSTGTLYLGGDDTYELLNGRTFNNQGTVDWLNGSYAFDLENWAVFNNESGAVFNANTPYGTSPTAQTIAGDNTATFTNAGTFTNASGSGNTTDVYGAVFNNSGTVNVTSGNFQISTGGTSSGSFSVSSGCNLNFGGGEVNLSSASVSGAGTVNITGGEVDFGAFATTGTVNVEVGTANFLAGGSSGAFNNFGGTVNLATGTTLSVSGNYVQSGGSTYLNSGTLNDLGNVSIDQSSSLYGPGTINAYSVLNGGTIYVGGGGDAVGVLTINILADLGYGFKQSATGALYLNIGGGNVGSQYDLLDIRGGSYAVADLGGTLDLALVYGYNPPSGTQFDLLYYWSESGDFGTKILPSGWSAAPSFDVYTATA